MTGNLFILMLPLIFINSFICIASLALYNIYIMFPLISGGKKSIICIASGGVG